MIKVDITANNVASSYRVPMILGESILGIKWDSGAKYTVISVKVLNSDLSGEDLERIMQYCDAHSNHREQFISASGHSFDGYLVTARDVTIGNTVFPEFHYYLVVENQRDVALLGYDFTDCCKSSHDPHSDIIVTEFDDASYGAADSGAMDSDEVIAFIDSLSVDE